MHHLRRLSGPQRLALVVLTVFALGSIFVPRFLSLDNVTQVLRQMAVPALIAVGVTFVVICGRLDLSVGALMSCCAIAAVDLHNSLGPGLAIAATIALGLLVGCINGFLVAVLGLNSLISTLGMLSVLQGATMVYTRGGNALVANAEASWFSLIGRGYWAGVPTPVWIAGVAALGLAVLLGTTTFGRRVFAVGGNATASAYSSINAKGTIFASYVIAGGLTAIAAIVYGARVSAARNDSGSGLELLVLSAIILGGTSLLGGSGSIARTLVGVLVLGFVQNALLLLGLPYYLQWIITALVIVVAVWGDLASGRGKVFV